jgi:hypothetical protein
MINEISSVTSVSKIPSEKKKNIGSFKASKHIKMEIKFYISNIEFQFTIGIV